jgi:hypothetical protein
MPERVDAVGGDCFGASHVSVIVISSSNLAILSRQVSASARSSKKSFLDL